MGCFIAPVTEAVIVSAVKKRAEKKEKVAATSGLDVTTAVEEKKIPFSRKLGWLTNMLWGGSFLLAIEHIWHGEVVPYFPFLTALNNPADVAPMLMEIATVGVTMTAVVTSVWGLMLLATRHFEKNPMKNPSAEKNAKAEVR